MHVQGRGMVTRVEVRQLEVTVHYVRDQGKTKESVTYLRGERVNARRWYYLVADYQGGIDIQESPDPMLAAGQLNWRGPFPTPADAESRMWVDDVPAYWEAGLDVYAVLCPGCGRYAKRLAGTDIAGGWRWAVSECKKCGIRDTRTPDED